ncbi:precorrin-8X methylmutase [Faecalibacterium sp. An77]|uniref:precorrin-8X methylmutase n=1 Tax=Faecalibacterium sp. An77 TaxID=1965655 RepID=UPI000B365D05|nr:precorrin-8X methylmutase [Faecalibacterium sp. An77]OUN40596.1 precorrin-8X methylmutase [Faecalibacterium sp. An77]
MSEQTHKLPGDIERTSLAIIAEELAQRGLTPPLENEAVVRRVVHATADFEYAENLRFTPEAVRRGAEALAAGAVIVTDTNMALAGVSKPALAKLGGAAFCYMADPAVAAAAKEAGTTRAVAAMKYAARQHPGAVFAVGNAPTALFALCDAMEAGDFRPALIIGVPVGFVNVVESKERLMSLCEKLGVPAIAAMGRKGGSSVAAAVCNALLYTAAGQLDPAARGWQG